MSRPCPGLALALLAALSLASILGRASAQAGGVEVRTYTPDQVLLGGNSYVVVRGLLVNTGPVAAADIQVGLRIRRSPGGEILAPQAFGLSWLGTLAPGQSGPFSVAVRYCCPADVGDYELTLGWRGTSQLPYRGTTATPWVTRDTRAGPRLFGELVNDGGRLVDASTVRVYVGFWSGEQLVDARAALVPVVFDDGPGGMALGDAQALPWSTTVPERAYDRVEAWSAAEPYPEGRYPVPLGVQDIEVLPADPGVTLTADLRHCGVVPVDDLYLVMVARDDRAQPIQFESVLWTDVGLAPGDRRRISVPWTSADVMGPGTRVDLQAFALAVQAEPPRDDPCRPLARTYLPALWR